MNLPTQIEIPKVFERRFPALGLIEVLIVLGIIGTAVIGISRLAITSLLDIRDDELAEYASGVMVQGLEISKSAQGIPISQLPNAANPIGSYSLVNSESGYSLKYQLSTTELIIACDRNSPYLMVPTGLSVETVPNVCAQVVVRGNSAIDRIGFEIVSNIVYEARGETRSQTAKSYRYLEVNATPGAIR